MDCSSGSCEKQTLLLAELARLHELVLQLEARLGDPSSPELCKSLTLKILSSVKKSICMTKSSISDSNQQQLMPAFSDAAEEFPSSASQSPRSETSNLAFKDHARKEMYKKRKTLPKWTKQVRVGVGAAGVEGPTDDGYSWRKYGQKDILGAKHPRGYYRCTHRHTQGCLATKQVQRSDKEASTFDVTYHGTHTCLHQPQLPLPSAPQELLSFGPGLKFKPEGLAREAEEGTSLSFSFGSLPVPKHIFSSASISENCFNGTSEPLSNNLSQSSPCPVSSSGFEALHKLHTSESDFTDIISASNSAAGSPGIDLDFMLEPLDFSYYQFDDSSLFS